MRIARNISELHQALSELEHPLGFVPTMGYLHTGHLSLVQKAREENPSLVVSIFTNPTQFAPTEDLENYPTDLPRDLEMLEKEHVDLVWLPSASEMYPEGYQTWVEVASLTTLLEGIFRPTHFRGVTTVVAKLFNAVKPDKAYFGQKDAQQTAVIQQMVRDLNYALEIVVCPTVRDADGLAMSSRNIFLSALERKAALSLFGGLLAAREAFLEGERQADNLRAIITREIESEELTRIQYISCADPFSLEELAGEVKDCLLSLAVYVGKTRLIDNIRLSAEKVLY